MIPFELTEYPKTCTCNFEEPSEEFPSGVTNVPLSCLMHGARVAIFAKLKRLTHAELAAEYESARCDALLVQATGHYWQSIECTWSQDTEPVYERERTLLRFATLPHYDEKETP